MACSEMTSIPANQSDRPSEYDFEELFTQLGGVDALQDDPNDFRKAVNRLWAERKLLIGTHPNK